MFFKKIQFITILFLKMMPLIFVASLVLSLLDSSTGVIEVFVSMLIASYFGSVIGIVFLAPIIDKMLER